MKTVKLITIFLFWSAIAAFAESPTMNEEMKKPMESQFAKAVEALKLTEEQIEPFRKFLEKSLQQQAAILEKYGMAPGKENERPGIMTMRKIRREISESREKNEGELKKILSAVQMELWKEFSAESRNEMRERLKSSKDSE
jgi:flagellar biosynthesis protein FliP